MVSEGGTSGPAAAYRAGAVRPGPRGSCLRGAFLLRARPAGAHTTPGLPGGGGGDGGTSAGPRRPRSPHLPGRELPAALTRSGLGAHPAPEAPCPPLLGARQPGHSAAAAALLCSRGADRTGRGRWPGAGSSRNAEPSALPALFKESPDVSRAGPPSPCPARDLPGPPLAPRLAYPSQGGTPRPGPGPRRPLPPGAPDQPGRDARGDVAGVFRLRVGAGHPGHAGFSRHPGVGAQTRLRQHRDANRDPGADASTLIRPNTRTPHTDTHAHTCMHKYAHARARTYTHLATWSGGPRIFLSA